MAKGKVRMPNMREELDMCGKEESRTSAVNGSDVFMNCSSAAGCMFNSTALWWWAATLLQHHHPVVSISSVMMSGAEKGPNSNVPIDPSTSHMTAVGRTVVILKKITISPGNLTCLLLLSLLAERFTFWALFSTFLQHARRPPSINLKCLRAFIPASITLLVPVG